MEPTKIIDMHCDTIERLVRVEKNRQNKGDFCEPQETLRNNKGHLDLERMKKGGYFLQNFALFVDMQQWENPWEGLTDLYQYYDRETKNNADIIMTVRSYADVESALRNGKMCALLTVEEGGVCCGEIEKLRKLHTLGVRMMTLTWNYENELGFPAVPRTCRKENANISVRNRGLTSKGKEFVVEMETLGIILDVSHLSDRGVYDVLQITAKPFVASHSNARTICPHGRNLTDDMIRKIALRGGCVGLNFHEDFIISNKSGGKRKESLLEVLATHAVHIANVGGMEVLGLGSDFDGIPTNPKLPGVQNIERLWDALKKIGFTEKDLDGVFSGNVLRVYKECLCIDENT